MGGKPFTVLVKVESVDKLLCVIFSFFTCLQCQLDSIRMTGHFINIAVGHIKVANLG